MHVDDVAVEPGFGSEPHGASVHRADVRELLPVDDGDMGVELALLSKHPVAFINWTRKRPDV